MQLLGIREVEKYAGRTKTQIMTSIKRGEFPKPLALSPRAKRWIEDEIVAWQNTQIAKRDGRRAA